MNKAKKIQNTTKQAVNYTDLLAAVNWEPKFFADIDESEEDSDYLRKQQCCTSCGGYTGICQDITGLKIVTIAQYAEHLTTKKKWSEEVRRIMKREKLDKDEIKDTLSALAEYSNV